MLKQKSNHKRKYYNNSDTLNRIVRWPISIVTMVNNGKIATKSLVPFNTIHTHTLTQMQ